MSPRPPSSAGPPGAWATSDVTGDLRVSRGVVLPAAELQWRFSRGSGPGGQGVNTTDSRVELRWTPSTSRALSEPARLRLLARLQARLSDGDVVVTAAEHREQRRNRAAARQRLAGLVADGLRPPPAQRRATAPSRRARSRRTDAKTARGRTKALRGRVDDG